MKFYDYSMDLIKKIISFVNKPVDSNSLKIWLRNSVVVNSNGEPLIVFHGTQDGNLTMFNKGKITWFTANRKYSEKYALKSGIVERFILFLFKPYMYGSKKVISCYIRLENPLDLGDTHNGWWHQEQDKKEFLEKIKLNPEEVEAIANKIKPYRVYELTSSNEFCNYLKIKGYDGMVGEEYGNKVFAVFEPIQIKFSTRRYTVCELSYPE